MVKELSHIFCPSAFDHTFGMFSAFCFKTFGWKKVIELVIFC